MAWHLRASVHSGERRNRSPARSRRQSRARRARRSVPWRKLYLARPNPRRVGFRALQMARDKDNIALSDEHNSRGIELADRGWLDEAIKEFKKAIDLDPNSAHAHDNLAT